MERFRKLYIPVAKILEWEKILCQILSRFVSVDSVGFTHKGSAFYFKFHFLTPFSLNYSDLNHEGDCQLRSSFYLMFFDALALIKKDFLNVRLIISKLKKITIY